MKPTLLVLAAGMGSRYGGLKQMDGLGPGGETIMDYSIYDAICAGFGKVVFVIRRDFETDFREIVLSKYEGRIDVEVVFQDMDNIPEGFSVPEGRVKPWGTNHAVLMARGVIREPFAVINADDFYGRESFRILAAHLSSIEYTEGNYAMVGYHVCNTLSEGGAVARGVCETDSDGYLTKVTERTRIIREDDGVIRYIEDDFRGDLEENTPVSMNMWAFTPDYFVHSDEYFRAFLEEHGRELKSEFYIPLLMDSLIKGGKATCKVLDTPSRWFGVTYASDRQSVVERLKKLTDEGTYHSPLFQ